MLISVCMATYNGEEHLREQVDSIMGQRLPDFPEAKMELVVSDDESKDDTINILESYQDRRIKIYSHHSRRSHRYYKTLYAVTENFANALSKASGDYIFLSDQDDIWHPKKLNEQLKVLTQKGGVCATAFARIDANRKVINRIGYRRESFWKPRKTSHLYGFSCGFAREELKYILQMPSVPQHDWFIQLIALKRDKMMYINQVLAAHRVKSSSSAYTALREPLWVKLYTRIKLISIVLWRCMTR